MTVVEVLEPMICDPQEEDAITAESM